MKTLTINQAGKLFRYDIDYLSLASTPHDEKCTQAGEDYQSQVLECQALAGQLVRMFGTQKDTELFIIRNEHEFGTYLELGIMYKFKEETEEEILQNDFAGTEPDTAAIEFAQKLEDGIPDKWDFEAIKFLSENDYALFGKVVPMYRKTA